MTYYVDFENVSEDGLIGIENLKKEDTVILYYSTECKMHVSMAETLMNSIFKVRFVKLPVSIKEKNIKNALDILLVYDVYKEKKDAIIISKDKGYDECFEEIEKTGSKCLRYESIAEVFGKKAENTSVDIDTIKKLFKLELKDQDKYKDITIQLIKEKKSREEIGKSLFKAIRNDSAGIIMKTIRPYLTY